MSWQVYLEVPIVLLSLCCWITKLSQVYSQYVADVELEPSIVFFMLQLLLSTMWIICAILSMQWLVLITTCNGFLCQVSIISDNENTPKSMPATCTWLHRVLLALITIPNTQYIFVGRLPLQTPLFSQRQYELSIIEVAAAKKDSSPRKRCQCYGVLARCSGAAPRYAPYGVGCHGRDYLLPRGGQTGNSRNFAKIMQPQQIHPRSRAFYQQPGL